MQRAFGFSLLVISTFAGLSLSAGHRSAAAEEITFFRIGTGSTAGTYYPVGALIANAISNPPGSRACEAGGSCGVPGVIGAAVATQGSVANINAIATGALESGLAQSDTVDAAIKGTGPFANGSRRDTIRVVANLYPESLHLVVRKEAGIESIDDLRGKRVSLDTKGSGTRVIASLVLDAFGIGEDALIAADYPPGEAVDMMFAGEVDAFFLVAGYPTRAVSELARVGMATLLPIADERVFRLLENHPYLAVDQIPADTYAEVGETDTVSVGAQWVVDADLEEEFVYRLTEALWHPNNRPLLDSGHDKARLIQLETALKGVSAPLHPGAERYYRERDMVTGAPPRPKRRPPT